MTKTKERVEKVEDFKAQMNDFLLGIDAIDKDIIEETKKSIITSSKNLGEEHIEEVINTITSSMEKIKNPMIKPLLATVILIECPINLQKIAVKRHNELIDRILAARIIRNSKNGSLQDLIKLIESLTKNSNNNE